MSKKRITYRPSKGQATFGGIVGILFVLIGVFVAIPTFGLFGLVWTLVAVGITVTNFYQAYGKNYMGPEIHVEEGESPVQSGAGSSEQRLKELRSLYDQRLITQEEYDAKRQEILDQL